MDRITTEEMERIVKGSGNLNGHAYKTDKNTSDTC